MLGHSYMKLFTFPGSCLRSCLCLVWETFFFLLAFFRLGPRGVYWKKKFTIFSSERRKGSLKVSRFLSLLLLRIAFVKEGIFHPSRRGEEKKFNENCFCTLYKGWMEVYCLECDSRFLMSAFLLRRWREVRLGLWLSWMSAPRVIEI